MRGATLVVLWQPIFMQRNVPRGLAPYLLVQDRLILSKAHHSNPSTCTKVVKILTYNQLHTVWKRWCLLREPLECRWVGEGEAIYISPRAVLFLFLCRKLGAKLSAQRKSLCYILAVAVFLPLAFNLPLVSPVFF